MKLTARFFISTICLALLFAHNYSFALSKDEFKSFGKKLVRGGREELKNFETISSRCHWGIESSSDSLEIESLHLNLLKAGLRVGDVIKQVGSTKFSEFAPAGAQFKNVVAKRGKHIDWVVMRADKEITLPVKCEISYKTMLEARIAVGREMHGDRPRKCISEVKRNEPVLRKHNSLFQYVFKSCYTRALRKGDISKTTMAYGLYELGVKNINEFVGLYTYSYDKELAVETFKDELWLTTRYLYNVDFPSLAEKLINRFNSRLDELGYVSVKQQPKSKPKESQIAKPQTPEEKLPDSSGTGFYVTDKGHIATNYHVIDGCKSIKLGDENLQIIAKDKPNDLAVLKSKQPNDKYAYISPNSPKLLDKIKVYGFPLVSLLGETLSATAGEVSSLSGFQDNFSQFTISAPIQPGNSGGPILNSNNEVVGVVVATLDNIALAQTKGVMSQNVNFGIRANLLINILMANGIELDSAPQEGPFDYLKITKLLTCYK